MRKKVFAICFVLLTAQSVFAALTVTSSQVQIETSGLVNPSMLITGQTPWDFSGQNYMALNSIDEISVTLTLLDGDTALSDFDWSEIVLDLDGLDTGLALNGFAGDQTMVDYTVTGTNQAAGLLNALQSDGLLLGRLLDLSPNDNYIKVRGGYMATLSLTDHEPATVPVPGSVLLSSLGVLTAGWLKRKRDFSA